MTAQAAAPRLSGNSIVKVAATSAAATSIEWYDFFIYGTAAALVFPKLFFAASLPPAVAQLAAFSTFAVGFIARMTRSAMLDVLNQDYIRTAESKGLPRAFVVLRHGLPNALIPILTVIGIVAGGLLGGAVVVEQVFSLPGLGRLVIEAIKGRDFAVVQAGLLLIAAIYLLVNLLVDVLYAIADPRVRLT